MLNVKRGKKHVAERFVRDGREVYVLFAYHLGSDVYHICYVDFQDNYFQAFYRENAEGEFYMTEEPDLQTQQTLEHQTGPLV